VVSCTFLLASGQTPPRGALIGRAADPDHHPEDGPTGTGAHGARRCQRDESPLETGGKTSRDMAFAWAGPAPTSGP